MSKLFPKRLVVTATFLFAAALCLTVLLPLEAAQPPFHLKTGYSTRGIFNANREDVRAAMAVLTRKIISSNSWTGESHSYDSTAEMERDVRDGRVHLVGILSDEYLQLSDNLPLEPLVISSSDKGINMGLVLLVRKDSGIRTLRELRGHSITLAGKSRQLGNLYHVWLETILLKEGIRDYTRFFSSVKEIRSGTQLVMPVFFRQTDACVATMQEFEAAAELNPQVGKELVPVASIHGLSPGLIVVDRRLPAEIRQKLLQCLLTIHQTPEGRQMLVMFKVARLVPFRREYLEGTQSLLKENRRLKSGGPVTKLRKTGT